MRHVAGQGKSLFEAKLSATGKHLRPCVSGIPAVHWRALPFTVDSKHAISNRAFAICLATILLLGLLLRLPGLCSGLPYSSYIDEGHILLRVMHLLRERTWDPAWYNYPSLTMYLISGAILLGSLINFLIFGDWISVPENIGQFYSFLAPTEVLVIGRITTLLLSVGAVWLAARLACRLAGRRAGLLAGLSAAITPALVVRGGFVMVDTVAAFFLMASLNAALEVERHETHRFRWAFFCGLGAGWAFTAKYPSGAVILSLLPVVAFLSISLRDKVALIVASAMGLFAGMLTGMPSLVLRTHEVVHAIAIEVGKYSHKVSARSYLLESLRWEEVGWFFPSAALGGVVVLLWRRPDRAIALGWILMATAFLLPLLRSSFQPVRNLEPLFVLGCVTVGVLAWGEPLPSRFRTLASSGIVAAMLVAPIITLPNWSRKSWKLTDSRTIAVDWMVAHARVGERVLVAREIVLTPSEVARIPGEVEVVGRPRMIADLQAHKPIAWIVTGEFLPPKGTKEMGAAELRAIESMTRGQASWAFGRTPIPPNHNLWYGNRPRIVIYDMKPTLAALRADLSLALGWPACPAVAR